MKADLNIQQGIWYNLDLLRYSAFMELSYGILMGLKNPEYICTLYDWKQMHIKISVHMEN